MGFKKEISIFLPYKEDRKKIEARATNIKCTITICRKKNNILSYAVGDPTSARD